MTVVTGSSGGGGSGGGGGGGARWGRWWCPLGLVVVPAGVGGPGW